MGSRERQRVPVVSEVATAGKFKWFTRCRALYALKMLGRLSGAPAAAIANDPAPLDWTSFFDNTAGLVPTTVPQAWQTRWMCGPCTPSSS